ncbi:MAG TPA: hypothetical protein VLK85_24155 [Ramlibacter sp.]|nr:hypothetical protein [Ramlibacter sp.]
MPDMQQNEPAPPAGPVPPIPVVEDFEALGCECANPMLQIERWQQECGQAVAPQAR